jgi:hypothetical protein
MHTLVGVVVIGILLLVDCFAPTLGAELYAPPATRTPPGASVVAAPVYPSCKYVKVCGELGCKWLHTCWRRCPDRYSCYSLYGAYGPYGGTRYWGAYTTAGWGYR